MSNDTRQGYRPCSVCGCFGGERREIDGTRKAVTAPRGVSVQKGESWTCRLCVNQGHEQKVNETDREPALM